MSIAFTLNLLWIEIACHFLAAILYITSGLSFADGSGGFILPLFGGIALTVFASQL